MKMTVICTRDVRRFVQIGLDGVNDFLVSSGQLDDVFRK
jgi:hypothetical protein